MTGELEDVEEAVASGAVPPCNTPADNEASNELSDSEPGGEVAREKVSDCYLCANGLQKITNLPFCAQDNAFK